MGAMMIYFTKGIKVEHLSKWTGRYYRFALMIKLVLFEILIVSLQMLPKTQLLLMSLIQLFVMCVILKALFIDRIYNHKFFGFMDLVTELTVFCYLMIGNVSTWMGEENLNPSTWTKI
jgi:presenilin-like A22 family membrane protease